MNLISATSLTLAISCTATSSTSQALPGLGGTIRFVNEGPNHCYVSVGTGAQTATLPPTSNPTATCTPVLSGEDLVLSVPIPTTPATGNPVPFNIAAVCRSGETATLLIQVGTGS